MRYLFGFFGEASALLGDRVELLDSPAGSVRWYMVFKVL